MLYAERFASPDAAQKVVTLLARRAKIYAYINELIADTSACVADTTIAGLAFGSLIEWQVGSLELARQHLGFVRHTLLPKRTGSQALPFFTGLCIYNNILSVGLGKHAFQSSQTMKAAVRKFVSIMSVMQQQPSETQGRNLQQKQPLTVGQGSGSAAEWWAYLLRRQKIFGRSSILYHFLVPVDPEDALYSSHQLVLLWTLNKMLLELRRDLRMSAEFLDELYRYVESVDNPSPFGSREPREKTRKTTSNLKPFTVTSMIGYISWSYLPQTHSDTFDWTSENSTQQERPLLRFWEYVDMCECIQYLAKVRNCRTFPC